MTAKAVWDEVHVLYLLLHLIYFTLSGWKINLMTHAKFLWTLKQSLYDMNLQTLQTFGTQWNSHKPLHPHVCQWKSLDYYYFFLIKKHCQNYYIKWLQNWKEIAFGAIHRMWVVCKHALDILKSCAAYIFFRAPRSQVPYW